ncbi:MAG: DUF2335 domain-containing protein [Rubellimicrobium sp.]|nr:DUF2335 domain-containing protein [Rubellimicrobium sp.]
MARHPARSADPDGADSPSAESLRIEDAIERALEGRVARRDLPDVARQITRIVVSEQFFGPMPHPKHLREYEDTLPGAAERILSMAERTLDHNAAMEQTAIDAEIADRKLGMLIGAGLFALMIVAAFGTLFITDNPVVPGLFLGAAAIGGVVAFIKGRNGR